MRLGSMLMTLVGLGIAGGAVFVAQDQITKSSEAAAAAEIVRVVAAAEEIPFGAQIEAHMLTTINWPRDAVPPSAFTSMSAVLPDDSGQHRRAKRALVQGEILLSNKVSNFGEKVTIVQTLAEGNRAMSIKVDASSGVGGFVTPGDRVDIVLTRGSNASMRALTILQNIRIIGVDQTADEYVDQAIVARTVTVEVTADDGQKLALAQQAGKLSLALRSLESEGEDTPLAAVRLSDILLDESPAVEGQPRPVVRIRRAIQVSEVPVRKVEGDVEVEDESVAEAQVD